MLGPLFVFCQQGSVMLTGDISPTFSSYLSSILDAMTKLARHYITFSYTMREQTNVKPIFIAKSSSPNIIKAIGYTHNAIRAPHIKVYSDVHHLVYHTSFEAVKLMLLKLLSPIESHHFTVTQVICNVNKTLTNIVAWRPASAHDPLILKIMYHISISQTLWKNTA